MKRTLGQIAHDAGQMAGKWQRCWADMPSGQRAEWEALAQAVASEVKYECCSKDDEIAELKRNLEERDVEFNSCSQLLDYALRTIEVMENQLAESQAREARMREALCNCLVEHPDKPFVHLATWRVKEALALPHDDTALKEYRDVVIEECIATTNQVLDGLEDADNVADALREMKGGA